VILSLAVNHVISFIIQYKYRLTWSMPAQLCQGQCKDVAIEPPCSAARSVAGLGGCRCTPMHQMLLAPFDDWTTSSLALKHEMHQICHDLCANFALNSHKTPHFPTWEVEINSHLRQIYSHYCYGGPLYWYMTWSYWGYAICCFLRLIHSFRLYRLCSYIYCNRKLSWYMSWVGVHCRLIGQSVFYR